MSITSFVYLAFVGISLIIYWAVPKKNQWLVLLADSLIFYFVSVKPYTFVYIIVSVLTVYAATVYFTKTDNIRKKRLAMVGAVVVNVGMLVLLKYTNMFIGTFNLWTGKSVGLVNWIAPLAMSYYTLQIVSYLIDCYGGEFEPEKNPFKLLLYTVYFPLMVSGPICRYSQIGGQLFEGHGFDYDRVVTGMRRVLWGMAKKVIVADNAAHIVSCMFDNTDVFSGPWVLIAAIGFLMQLYFDFSGCMDIALGVSKCFGIILPENFNAPFMSRSVQEYWQRWHVTLGNWLKDYVMFPISRSAAFRNWSRKLKKKWGRSGQKIPYYIAMFVVWSLIGVWHGSSWKYMIGLGWFFYIVIVSGQIFEPLFKKQKELLHINEDSKIWNAFQIVRTFLLASIGNIAFRASSLPQTFYMYKRAFVWTGVREPIAELMKVLKNGVVFNGEEYMVVVFVAIGVLQLVCDFRQYHGKFAQTSVAKWPVIVRWAAYYFIIIILLTSVASSEFIYFQF